jgi:hypothetical protein
MGSEKGPRGQVSWKVLPGGGVRISVHRAGGPIPRKPDMSWDMSADGWNSIVRYVEAEREGASDA